MWSRDEARNDLISTTLIVNLSIFGPLMKCRALCNELCLKCVFINLSYSSCRFHFIMLD